jgi:hypothetical protein
MSKDRQIFLTFSELIERLTVTQLRESLLKDGRDRNSQEIAAIESDLDLIIEEKGIKLTARLIRQIMVIGQINALIWGCKDRMQTCSGDTLEEKEAYNKDLRLSHQLNGIRNRMRNFMLVEIGDSDVIAPRSNTNIDGLDFFVSMG